MFSFTLVMAIFTYDFLVEAKLPDPPRCNETTTSKIYTYWKENGGVPKNINENNIKCRPREIVLFASPMVLEEDVECAAIDHIPKKEVVYLGKGNNVSIDLSATADEENGVLFNSTSKRTRFPVAEIGCTRLLHLCTRSSSAPEGPDWYVIKSVDGKATKEGIKAIQDLMTNTLGSREKLRSFSDTCPLPKEKPGPVGKDCPNKCQ